MARRFLSRLFLVVLCCCALASAATELSAAPVVVAVDTSRSLSAADLAQVSRAVGDLMAQLPAGTSAGLLRFADSPEWIERPGVTPAQVGAALSELRPEGSYTLLHDAVFEAARALPGGGAVLVVTDGRDENSATTVDDIARLCEAQGVRVFTAAVGARRDDRLLRRLALVTGGEYAGPVVAIDSARLARTLAEAPPAVPAAAAPEPAPAPREEPPAGIAPGEDAAAAAAAETPPAASSLPRWLLGLAVVALLAIAAIAGLLTRRRKRASVAECRSCGKDLATGEGPECAACRDVHLLERLHRQPPPQVGSAIEAFLDTGVFPQMSLEERLERTFVMQEIAVLQVKEPGEPVRSFQLDTDRAFSVGRSPDRVSLALPDPTLSAEHFRIVPYEGDFYLVDSGSTNGTLRNGERLRLVKLRPGDILRAGQAEFTFAIQQSARAGERRDVVRA